MLTTLHYRYLRKEKNKPKCLPAKMSLHLFYVVQPDINKPTRYTIARVLIVIPLDLSFRYLL